MQHREPSHDGARHCTHQGSGHPEHHGHQRQHLRVVQEREQETPTRLIRARASPTAEYAVAGRGLSEPEVGGGGG